MDRPPWLVGVADQHRRELASGIPDPGSSDHVILVDPAMVIDVLSKFTISKNGNKHVMIAKNSGVSLRLSEDAKALVVDVAIDFSTSFLPQRIDGQGTALGYDSTIAAGLMPMKNIA